MNRRVFLTTGIGAVAAASGVYYMSSQRGDVSVPSISEMISTLEQCKSKTITSMNNWSPEVVFQHCAQSVTMSILGYPEHKSDMFKSTVGTLAFAVFEANGAMTHDLVEPIPGAPTLDETASLSFSIDMLIRALQRFVMYEGEFAPHFAYGHLTKRQYAAAHIMHIQNHFEQLTIE